MSFTDEDRVSEVLGAIEASGVTGVSGTIGSQLVLSEIDVF